MTTFAHLGLPDPLVRALRNSGVVAPFPVQAAAIPDALAGRDVCGKAPTGSGKTLAFGLPLLATVDAADRNRPHALVLAPTRELAQQISEELIPLAKSVRRRVSAVYGGVGYGPQKGRLRAGVDVLVATPGRLEDLIAQRSVDLGQVDIVVVDEADRMADMGFLPAVRRILDQTSPDRQTLLFSATLDGDVAVLSRDYQHDPVRHEAGTVEAKTVDATHHFWQVTRTDRLGHAAEVVAAMGRSIVFTRTRHGADRLAKQLDKRGVGAVSLHGGRSQGQRTRALAAFSSGRSPALVATDVAARGIHVDDVACVIHFDPPHDAKDYLHRSGRTGRAGAAGSVVSFVSGDQQKAVRRMQRDLGMPGGLDAPQLHLLGEPSTRAPAQAVPSRQSNGDGGGRQSIYVANLPWSATTDEVEELFGRHGSVHAITIVTDRRTRRSRGFGFVEMNAADARVACDELHGATLGGRELIVRPARPPRRRSA